MLHHLKNPIYQHISETLIKYEQKGRKLIVICDWDAFSLCWTVVAASNYSISSLNPCEPRPFRAWSVVSLQQFGEPSQANCPYFLCFPCPLSPTPDFRFFSSCDGFAKHGPCYRLPATSPPNVPWAVEMLKRLTWVSPGLRNCVFTNRERLKLVCCFILNSWGTYICT